LKCLRSKDQLLQTGHILAKALRPSSITHAVL
jgi:hypothetical protein